MSEDQSAYLSNGVCICYEELKRRPEQGRCSVDDNIVGRDECREPLSCSKMVKLLKNIEV